MQNIHKIKQDMCDIGRRIYNRQFAAANDGNITVRVSDNEVSVHADVALQRFFEAR